MLPVQLERLEQLEQPVQLERLVQPEQPVPVQLERLEQPERRVLHCYQNQNHRLCTGPMLVQELVLIP